MTIGEVTDYLKVTERTICRLAGVKKIPTFKAGGTWSFRKVEIDGRIAAQTRSAGGYAG